MSYKERLDRAAVIEAAAELVKGLSSQASGLSINKTLIG
jgi:hypothetical protein